MNGWRLVGLPVAAADGDVRSAFWRATPDVEGCAW